MKEILLISDTDLLIRLKAKDTEAYRIAYHKYSGALLGVIRRIVHDTELADAILQQTYINVYKSIQNFDGRSTLFIFFLNSARTLSFDKLDILNKRYSSTYNRIATLSKRKLTINFEQKTDKADEDTFVFNMVYYNGYTINELAEAFDVPPSEIKMRFRKGIKASDK